MAKLQYGNYSAWLTGDILRVACDNKLVRMETVPPDALRYFREAFDMDKRDAAREKAKALKKAQEASKPSKGKVGRPKKQNAAESLSGGNASELAPAPSVQSEPAPAQSAGSNVAPSEEPEVLPAPAPLPDEEAPAPTAPPQDANIYSQEDIDAVSIYSAPLKMLAEAMYSRFGVYTVFRGEMPEDEAISPLTARPMTAYQRGEAYQACRRAIGQRDIEQDFEQMKVDRDSSVRTSQELRETFDKPTQILSLADHRRMDTFDSRTSLAAMKQSTMESTYREDSDEPVAQPTFGEVIRPNW